MCFKVNALRKGRRVLSLTSAGRIKPLISDVFLPLEIECNVESNMSPQFLIRDLCGQICYKI